MPRLSPEQLAERRTFLGASDIWKVINDPMDLWLEKTGRTLPWEGNEATERGHQLEPVVAARYALAHPELEVYEADPPTRRHPRHHWAACSPDRLTTLRATGAPGGVELKTSGYWPWVRSWKGGKVIPEPYLLQVQWTIFVMGYQEWGLAALHESEDGDPEWRGYQEWVIPRDDELIEMAFNAAEKFWNYNIAQGVPPRRRGATR